MKKIPSIFVRDWDGDRRFVLNERNPVCQWVFDGEGHATRKWDGTSCKVDNGELFARYDYKKKSRDKGNKPPMGWGPCQPEPDEKSGHWPGWVHTENAPNNKYHKEFQEEAKTLPDGTYELCGPKVGTNPEGFDKRRLLLHGGKGLAPPARDYETLTQFFTENPMEGIVFHHPDGRMAKIKARDLNVEWPRENKEKK